MKKNKWEKAFSEMNILWLKKASQSDEILIASDQSGIMQLHIGTESSFKQLTTSKAGKALGAISSEGKWVYYIDDDGSEMGHLMAINTDDGRTTDLTPKLPRFSTFEFAESRDGSSSTLKGF